MGCHRAIVGLARAQVPGDSCLLPLRSRGLYQGRNQILRVGERQRSIQVCINDASPSDSGAEEQQLSHQVGRLEQLYQVLRQFRNPDPFGFRASASGVQSAIPLDEWDQNTVLALTPHGKSLK